MPDLAEDLALLLLDDETGRATIDLGRRHRTVGTALLIDLARAGRIGSEGPDHAPRVTDPTPTGDPVLDRALAAVGARNSSLTWAAETIGADCWEPLLARLVERGLLRHETGRTLGIFPRDAWPSAGSDHERALVDRLREVLVHGADPDERTALVVVLLHAVGAATAALPDEPADVVRARAAEITRSARAGAWGEAFRGLDTALLTVLLVS